MKSKRSDRGYLVLDIETVIDPELPLSAKVEQQPPALPPPPYHQVVVIGLLWMDASYRVIRIGAIGEPKNERQILTDFVKFMHDKRPDLVTYNGRGFDLPVIASRCLKHGVPFTHYFQASEVRYRYSSAGHFDLMDFMADFGAARAVPLDTMAKLIGLPGKVGVDGKDVGPMVHAGRIAEVEAYCLCDVVQTTGLFLRVQLIRGMIELDAYRAAMGSLLEMIGSDERLAPVHAGIQREKLMLE
ncbi:MAG: ribonuclease H-like domain-containing protein [Deltaproteobacteria bacterium]|nr:ribonuclease H-like domain-containing protein [Deltaproteobacteria bacterium]